MFVQRIRCPGGISEKDVDTYFSKLHREWGQSAMDSELHVRAVQLIRESEASILSNTEITIVGEKCAVRLVSGKGRTKIRVEPEDDKVSKTAAECTCKYSMSE